MIMIITHIQLTSPAPLPQSPSPQAKMLYTIHKITIDSILAPFTASAATAAYAQPYSNNKNPR